MASTNLYPLFTKGINRHFLLELKEYDPVWRNLFHMDSTSDRYIWHQSWEGYQLPEFRVPGERIAQGAFKPSFNKQYIIRTFGLGDSIPQEDIDDDLYAVINKQLAKKGGALARAFTNLLEYDTAQFFGVQAFASGTSVAGSSDGVSLFSTAHPISASQPLVTWSNRPSVAADLSQSSLQAAATALRLQKAPDNLTFLNNEIKTLVYNPVLEYVVRQLLYGKWKADSADRNENFLTKDSIEACAWPYFQKSGATGTNNGWFVQGREHYLYFFMRSGYKTNTDYDINTNSQIITALQRFDEGASSPLGMYGSPGI